MYLKAATTALLPLLSHLTTAATPEQWRSRSIYQLLTDRFARPDGSTTASCDSEDRTYCGGTFLGIIDRLDYIQGAGFDAVWISPVTAQIEGFTEYGEAFHGYWQRDLYAINPEFGTPDDLTALSDALHARGMYLMVDVVVNHNAYDGSPSDVDYGMYNPFNDESDYHPYCSINYDGPQEQIEQCWLGDTEVPLPDLRTEDPAIAGQYNTWIDQLVSNYSIDGLRLDTIIQVNQGFWSGFREAAGGIYMVGEAYDGDVDYVCDYQNVLPGVMNFPTLFPVVDAFTNPSSSLQPVADTINAVKASCRDTSLLGSFVSNHDRPRIGFLTSDLALQRNLMTYNLLVDGIPIVYQGQEQRYDARGSPDGNDPYNREALWFSEYNTDAVLYGVAAKMNALRKAAIANEDDFFIYQAWPVNTVDGAIVIRKGGIVQFLTNRGSDGGQFNVGVGLSDVGYSDGQVLLEVVSCREWTVRGDGGGGWQVQMEAGGLPRVFYPVDRLGGSGVCGR